MWRSFRGRLLVSCLALLVCAKAATSFPRSPLEIDTIESAGERPFITTVASEDPPPVFSSDTFSASEDVSETVHLPQCESPEDVLQSLSAERLLLDRQKQDLFDREAEVALAREKLEIEKDALQELKTAVEALLGKIESQQSEDLDRLIALYQNMKPAEAAAIMNDLDIEVMIMVLGAMQPRAAAPIFARMSPVRAGAVSKIILERSKLPGDQSLNGIRFN